MNNKYKTPARLALSGTPSRNASEGCWLDVERELEQASDVYEVEVRWQLWMACYEMTVLYENHWLLAAGCEEEGI